MQAEFFTTRPVTIDIPIVQPLYALVALGVVIFVLAWVVVHRHEWRQWLSKLPRLHEHSGVNVVYYAALILAVAWLPLTLLTLDGLFELWYSKPNPQGSGFTENTLRLHFLALAGLTTILAGLVGAPLALLRVHTVERQTTAQEQGLITDRINKAVASLGADKTIRRHKLNDASKRVYKKDVDGKPDYSEPVYEEITAPNLEVRIGAIYALERIAQDSLRDHIQIMEILCAYIRQNAPASEAPELPKPPVWFEGVDQMSDDSWKDQFDAWKQEHREALEDVKPRGDIQTALTVIGRRTEKQKAKEWGDEESYKAFQKGPAEFPEFEADDPGAPKWVWRNAVGSWHNEFRYRQLSGPNFRLDLRETNLCKANMGRQFQRADFCHARFEGADLQGTIFIGAKVQEANFLGVKAQRVDFQNAEAQGANFQHIQIQGANFSGVKAQMADLSHAQAQGVDFQHVKAQVAKFIEAKAQDANFRSAQAQRAKFNSAHTQGAEFSGAKLQGVDFANALAQRADFSDAEAHSGRFTGAQMQLAKFSKVSLQETDFSNAKLQGADFFGAKAQAVKFNDAAFDKKTNLRATELPSVALKSDVSMLRLSQEQLNAAFGDGFTTRHLPDGLTKPDQWPDWEMDIVEFNDEWRKWQREGEAYVPPPEA